MGLPFGSLSLPRTPGAATVSGVFCWVLYSSFWATGGLLPTALTCTVTLAVQVSLRPFLPFRVAAKLPALA